MAGHQVGDAVTMHAVLEQANAKLRHLLELLIEEAEYLANRDTQALDPLLARKSQALEELESLEQQRRALMLQAGLDPQDAAAMEVYAGDDDQLAQAWRDLTAQLVELKVRNEANGKIVHRTIAQVERDLNILSGYGSEGGGDTYDPQGRNKSPRGRKISSA